MVHLGKMLATSAHLRGCFGIDGTVCKFFLFTAERPKAARNVPDAMGPCNIALRRESTAVRWGKGGKIRAEARDDWS